MSMTATATERPRRRTRDDGFTLIELLVVIIIIGILAAIAVPFFIGQQTLARNAVATSDLSTIRLAMVVYSIDHNGTFTSNPGDLIDYGYASSTEAAPVFVVVDDQFCVQVESDAGVTFFATDHEPVQPGTCD